MDRSKVSSAAAAAGIEVTVVRSPAALVAAVAEEAVDVVVVDLGRADAIDAIAAATVGTGGARILAYGSHVDTERLDAAARAGADPVLARSAFFAEPARWMRG
jgi:DNA-binding NarL/FixJ family response regulator